MSTPTQGPKPPECNGHVLRESIDYFLRAYRKGVSDFSGVISTFFRLLKAMPVPPLEIIWVYSAVTFHGSNSPLHEPSKKIALVNELFQLLVLHSGSYSSSKSVAVLAPVMSVLCSLACDLSQQGLCLKGEIEGLVDGIVGYISMRCSNPSKEEQEQGQGLDDASDDLTVWLADLVRVWTVDRVGENCKDGLSAFFPLVSDEVRRRVSEGCGIDLLAGIVMSEALLLRLCFKFGSEASREKLQRDVESCVVQTARGFQRPCFCDVLLRVLSKPSLPVTVLLSSEAEGLLREVLYDFVILKKYSFLNFGQWTDLPDTNKKNLALTWSLVAETALQSVRSNPDQARANSYVNAFSESHIPNQLIEWVITKTGMEGKLSRQMLSTPGALIKWLVVLEDQGVGIFDDDMLKQQAKIVIDHKLLDSKIQILSGGGELIFEDQFMFYSFGDVLSAPSQTVNMSATEGSRKRKNGIRNAGKAHVKFVKYNCHENSIGEPCSMDDSLSIGSQVEIPISDVDMEDVR